MAGALTRIDKKTEKAIRDILRSRAQTRIYLFLLTHYGARSEEIIKGTRLHPSTVRELLVKMHAKRLIYREKLKNDNIGKNPYLYRAISPVRLLQKYADEIEERLNKIANLTSKGRDARSRRVQIKIVEGGS